ncbi:MAG: hypothetical protein IJ417_01890 [Bacteroidaceae bacterium]|nr:hypothetical protein [Bacteroidaceae bacterium]
MTNEDKNLFGTFEARLRQLMFLYDELEKEKRILEQDLANKEQKLRKLQQDYDDLEVCYTDLMQARVISITVGNVKDTKQRLSKLVHEIDKCLALLNGTE